MADSALEFFTYWVSDSACHSKNSLYLAVGEKQPKKPQFLSSLKPQQNSRREQT